MTRLLLILLLLIPGQALAAPAAVSLAVRERVAAAPAATVAVIIRMADRVDLTPYAARAVSLRRLGPVARHQHRQQLVEALRARADDSQQGLRSLLRTLGATDIVPLWINNSIAARVPAGAIDQIAAQPAVAAVVLDEAHPLEAPQPEAIAIPVNPLPVINAIQLQNLGLNGTGVVVAIFDTGVDVTHPSLSASYLGAGGWFDPYTTPATTVPYDPINARNPLGHGTEVASLAVGGNLLGVAPGARWIAAKLFNDAGLAFNSKIHQAFQWVLGSSADIVNNSWGFDPGRCVQQDDPVTPDSDNDTNFHPDIQALQSAGVLVVFSAGNDGPATATSVSPANYPEGFAVGSAGSIDALKTVSSFSSRGPSACDGSVYPELLAPGFELRMAAAGGGLAVGSGTSFSAPLVSGVAALLMQGFPAATLAELTAALKESAADLGAAGPDNSYGYGLVDALAAHERLANVPMIAVHETAPPEDDQVAAYGQLLPGSTTTITLRNAGGGSLAIGGLETGSLPAAVALIQDNCSGASLTAGASCTLQLQFSSVATGAFSGALLVNSSDPAAAQSSIALSGTINTPPAAATLLSPANGATAVPSVPLLQWKQVTPDADGEPVSNLLLISTDPVLAGATPVTVAWQQTMGRMLLAGGLGLLPLVLGCRHGRSRRVLWLLLALLFTAGLLACGGGGGGGEADALAAVPGELRSFQAGPLQGGTTYYWRILSTDLRGGTSQSPIMSFTTQ